MKESSPAEPALSGSLTVIFPGIGHLTQESSTSLDMAPLLSPDQPTTSTGKTDTTTTNDLATMELGLDMNESAMTYNDVTSMEMDTPTPESSSSFNTGPPTIIADIAESPALEMSADTNRLEAAELASYSDDKTNNGNLVGKNGNVNNH